LRLTLIHQINHLRYPTGVVGRIRLLTKVIVANSSDATC
jgi:hypothetical protein